MAQWHIIKASPDTLEVMVHFLVPTGSNQGGVTWKDAAKKVGLTAAAPSVWVTDSTEAASIAAGDIVEVQTTISVNRSHTVAQQKSFVQAAVTLLIAKTKAEWADALKLTGYSEGTVV